MAQGSKKKKRMRRILLAVDAVLLAGFAVSAFFLIRTLLNYNRMRRENEALAAVAVHTSAPTPEASPAPEAALEIHAPSDSQAPVKTASEEVPIRVDFQALQKINTDIVAWIYSEGTEINYPIVQASDNDYYLNRSYERKERDGGAIFMDCRNSAEFLDQNTVIYGHHMKDRTMFGSLANYYKQDYYEQHRVLYILTPIRDYRLEVYSVRTTKPEAEYYYIWFDPAATMGYGTYISKAIGQSTVANKTDMSQDYNTVTLSTCSYYAGFEDAKFLVHCKLVPLGD